MRSLWRHHDTPTVPLPPTSTIARQAISSISKGNRTHLLFRNPDARRPFLVLMEARVGMEEAEARGRESQQGEDDPEHARD